LKTSPVALLLALTITGCDQVIQRLSNKTSNNPSAAQPETAKESSPNGIPSGTEIPAKMDGRESDAKPAEHAINQKHGASPKNKTQRSEQKKTDVISQQQEAATVDGKGKSTIQEQRKADVKQSEANDTYTGELRRGNVSREY